MEQKDVTRLVSDNMKTIFAYSVSRLIDRQQAEDLASDIVVEIDALTLPDGEIQKAEFSSIEFINVSFKYPGTDKYILNSLSMKLEAKMHYAFVGINGAGKTTLTKILTGLYDDFEGEILINDKSIREYKASELKGLFSVVYQDFAKYYITHRDNIALGNVLDMNSEKINEALETIELKCYRGKFTIALPTFPGIRQQ